MLPSTEFQISRACYLHGQKISPILLDDFFLIITPYHFVLWNRDIALCYMEVKREYEYQPIEEMATFHASCCKSTIKPRHFFMYDAVHSDVIKSSDPLFYIFDALWRQRN